MDRLTARKGRFGKIELKACARNSHGISCDTNCAECIDLYESWKKLAKYEDAEENGLLIRLPCKIGSIVWVITTQRDNYDDSEYSTIIQANFRLGMLSQIDKTVFLSETEAKKALGEKNHEKD